MNLYILSIIKTTRYISQSEEFNLHGDEMAEFKSM